MSLRLAQVAEVRLGRQRAPQYEQGDHLVPYLRSANVVDGRLDLTDVKTMNFNPNEQAIFGLSEGDVLMTEGSGSAETVGASAVWQANLPGTVCFQNTLLRLRPRPGVTDGRFLAWWARHAHASRQIAAVTSGANIQHIGADGLKDLRIHVPEPSEQRRIADFLDDRVDRIDQIIAARRRQSALAAAAHLERSRHLTTVGLGTICKATSVAWMPTVGHNHVPWRVGQAFSTGSGTTPKSDNADYYDGDVAWATTSDLRDTLEVRPPRSVTSRALADYSALAVYPAGTLLVAMYGATVGRAGLLAVDATVNQACCALRSRGVVDPAYAFHWFVAHRPEIMTLASGGGQPNISQDVVRALQIPAPPWSEQQEILQLLHQSASEARAATDFMSASVALLQEYKQSLITAAVTGELDVTTAGSGIPG